MISPFNDGFQMLLLRRDERCHVALQQERERSFDLEDVAHQSAVLVRIKFMDVPEFPEKSADHLVDEAPRPINLGDARRKPLAHPEVPAFERQKIAELQPARCSSRLDDALAGERGAFSMNIDVEGEIEAQLNRRVDLVVLRRAVGRLDQ